MQLPRYSQRRINLMAAAILIAFAVLIGVIAFYVMQRQVESLLRTSLQTSLQGRVQWIQSEIQAASGRIDSIASRPFLIEQLRRVADRSNEADAVRQLNKYVLPALLQSGVSAIAIFDEHGRKLTSAGQLADQPELSVPLVLPGRPLLLWQAGLRLQSSTLVVLDGKVIGRLVAQTPLPAISTSFLAANPLGRTAEQAMCASSGHDMRCFPMTLNPHVTTFPKRSKAGAPLPMTHALEGRTGFILAKDYRKQNVVAAYSPVGSLGLGMVLKMDSAELYAPVWNQLPHLLPLTGAILLIALLSLRWQLTPLVAGLARSERNARQAFELLKDSEQRVQAVLENVDEGIITFSAQGVIEMFNPGAERMFGQRSSEVCGRQVSLLMPESTRARIDASLQHYLSTGRALEPGTAREVVAQRGNGEHFPMELRVSEFVLEGHRQFIGIVRDITERKSIEARISHLAQFDALTDLPNRGLVRDRIQQSIAAARRSGHSFAVMFLDLDKFKNVNDSLGHDIGDALLQQVAMRLTGALRAEDTVGRQGGDEFIVLLPGLGAAEDSAAVAQRLLDCIGAPFVVDEHELHSSVSIGIAVYPQDGEDVDTLLKHSDKAMYHAKAVGRSNYQYFSQALNAAAAERLLLEDGLSHALSHNELLLHYQPLVDMATGNIVAIEALVRWNHPQLGLIGPGRFIPMAEETGLIVPLGEWVLRQACEQMQRWRQQEIWLGRMVVNLSPRQFREKNLLATFSRILRETGTDPHWLGLEITESVIMESPEVSIEMLRGLKALGIEISLDDFGTGYSSLSYLKRFPIDKLKIDQSFVRDLGADNDDAAMVAAIIVMAHQLHIRVVAEGVETEAQLAFLRARGCDEYQGYLFSRPLGANQLDEHLQGVRG